MDITSVAQICHEANRAYCRTLGDFSQPSWREAPDWQKESAVKGVEYALAHPEVTPEAMHEAWANEKYAQGWVYGETKNPETKEHPCLVSYQLLPIEQRRKDRLFLTIVKALTTD